MKNILRRSLSLLLALCFVLGCTAMGVTAAEATVEKEYVFEAESTDYKAYNTSGAELTGASKTGVKYYGSSETGDCIHFTNSGLESISYTLNVEKEGSYDLTLFRFYGIDIVNTVLHNVFYFPVYSATLKIDHVKTDQINDKI